jgi:hypothetical protein
VCPYKGFDTPNLACKAGTYHFTFTVCLACCIEQEQSERDNPSAPFFSEETIHKHTPPLAFPIQETIHKHTPPLAFPIHCALFGIITAEEVYQIWYLWPSVITRMLADIILWLLLIENEILKEKTY